MEALHAADWAPRDESSPPPLPPVSPCSATAEGCADAASEAKEGVGEVCGVVAECEGGQPISPIPACERYIPVGTGRCGAVGDFVKEPTPER